MNRLSMAEPLESAEALVRELHPADAELMVAEAARGVPIVRGQIAVPTSLDEAVKLISEFEVLREKDQANLFGVFRPGGGSLAGVVSLTVDDDFVAEAACWNVDRERSRHVMAAGIGMITA